MAGNDQPLPATFLLTRNAALDLRRIHTRTCREWPPAFRNEVERLRRRV
ncbi:MAG: hypothetical protein KBD60_06590 [Sterolibacterium sp.]|jgi:hypothetical protein|nr:hypothetical protein [Sterolibacterium sp.]